MFKRWMLPLLLALALLQLLAIGTLVYIKQASSDLIRMVQNGPLPTLCLAELLDLSLDQPTAFHAFDVNLATESLQKLGIFKRLHIKKMRPSTLSIRYRLRTPLARLGGRSNTAIDAEGVSFPLAPYFPPLRLPIVYAEGFDEKQLGVLKMLLESLPAYSVEEVDLTQMNAPKLGRRGLVVRLCLGGHSRLLRLSCDRYLQEVALLAKLPLSETSTVIDLRLPQMALVY